MPRLTLVRPWGRLAVWVYGRGAEHVLAVHGLAGSGRYWEGLSRALGAGYTVVAPDLAGFGASGKPREHDYGREQHLADLDAVISEVIATSPLTVVGHSMGGILAGLLAARRMSRVQRLGLVAVPFPHGDGPPPPLGSARARDLAGRRRVFRTIVALWPVLSFFIRTRAYPHPVIADFLRNTPQSYWGTATSLIWSDGAATELEPLRAFARPALLLFSDDDRTVSATSRSAWTALLPAAERVSAPGGHQLLLRTHFASLARWLALQEPMTESASTASS